MADVIIIVDVITLVAAIDVPCVFIDCGDGGIGLVRISSGRAEVLHLLEDEVLLSSLHASQPPLQRRCSVVNPHRAEHLQEGHH